ncbi:MAG TPA: PqiC family protein [Steroidobacteraceae bacterium]|jgi:hypothetical protein|nr:PqiC family protein [Steroidobacteraceae bacterium]
MTVTTQPARVLSLIALALAGCAAPPLRLYTLSETPDSAASPVSTRGSLAVIRIDRVTLPPYLDTQDILVRDGHVLNRSQTGRWATRLSIAATDLLTARLAMRKADALVTDEPEIGAPDYEIRVHVSELDVTSSGEAVMAADWQIYSRTAEGVPIANHTRIVRHGSVATDENVVELEEALFDELADSIDTTRLHSSLNR